MADGTEKAIKDVKPGNEVVATDPDTGVTGAREVTETHDNHDELLTDVVLVIDGREVVVHTTAHHAFWSEQSQRPLAGQVARSVSAGTPKPA